MGLSGTGDGDSDGDSDDDAAPSYVQWDCYRSEGNLVFYWV